jgi:hypothetical protein
VQGLLLLPLLLPLLQELRRSLWLIHYKYTPIKLQHLACCMICSLQSTCTFLQSESGTDTGQHQRRLQSSSALSQMAQQLLQWQLPRLQLQQQLLAQAVLRASSCLSGCNAAAGVVVHGRLMAAGAAAMADAQVVLARAAVPQEVTQTGMKTPGSKYTPRLVSNS